MKLQKCTVDLWQDSKWKSNEHKCKQCRQWESEGEWFGRAFYCTRCCAKVAEQSHKDNYHEDAGQSSEPWLASYKEKWKHLVEMEWQEEMRVVDDRLRNWPVARLVGQGFCITDLEARKRGTFFGKAKIVFSKASLPRHHFSSGDEVIVSRGNPLDEKVAWKGEILELGMNRLAIVSDKPPWELTSGRWRLDRGANKTAYERTKSALGYVTGTKFRAPAMRKLVLNEEGTGLHKGVPAESDDDEDAWLSLDASQRAAARQAVEAPLSLIQGPPGTGKTTTTCHLIRRLVEKRGKDSRGCSILVAADSNVAVDQLLAGLIRLGVKALRIGFPSKVSQELRAHTLLAQAEEHPLNSKIEETREALSKVKDALYSGALKGKGKGLAHRDISLHVRDLQKYEQEVTDDLIANAEVICATLVGCGCDALLRSDFHTVVIDEASQATEPRCLIAFQKARAQLLMVGDQQQLPPVVLCQAAEEKGLRCSLFDRLLNSPTLFNQEISMLQVQYRMHPLIREWPSSQFYSDRLQDGLPISTFASCVMTQPFLSKSSPHHKAPIMFLDTSEGCKQTVMTFLQNFGGRTGMSNTESQNSDGSKYNLLEVELVKTVLRKLLEAGEEDVGVISPYAAQVAQIKSAMEAEKMLFQDPDARVDAARFPEVKTVDGYQGREKEVIILSCVRTQGLGFLSDRRRLNVGITRAKSLLVIIGCAELLQTDPVWRSYIHFLDRFRWTP
ncbi:NAM7 [Symbiodinium natans]|uniref:NAM7 protein n=1 Tax=Symbiodinium natans TaxID=878477 RepID=A0A812Q582_9DINO|nr:NAM7 [Symbiodinium natans]